MQFSPSKMKYDMAKTIFSPDGRLFQVEYAREAVKKGSTCLGLVYKQGVILAATRSNSKLKVKNEEKVFKADDHVGIAASGLVSDSRTLVDAARLEAQKNRMTYDEHIPTRSLAKFLADRKQKFTQFGGVRPYGTSMITGGTVNDNRVFQTDPSGTLQEWKAVAIGKNADEVNELFKKEYEEDMDQEEALKLAITGLKKSEDVDPENIELALLEEEAGFEKLSQSELKDLV